MEGNQWPVPILYFPTYCLCIDMTIVTIQNIKTLGGTSQAVQWLRLHTSTAGGTGSVPGQGTKILHPVPGGQKIFF